MEELYRTVIPEDLLFQGTMDLPAPLLSEQALKRHVSRLLAKNTSTEDAISFLGAGCYKRYIPAVCDEIANRSEFLTAYCGDTYSDHGKMQAIFEYASMMAELLELDVVSYPTYDAGQAVSSSFRMALRLRPGRNEILVPAHMNPEIRSQAAAYCRPFGTLVPVENPFGVLDLADLQAKLSPRTAAVFLENPAYLGAFEPRAKEIMDLAHQAGAIGIVMPEVSSLGVVTPPSGYGADITCGDIQPLGIHMQYGSGCGGFIAMDNDPDYVNELPTYLYGISETQKDGQYGWGRALYYRCSHASRENAKEYFGTECGLWAIVGRGLPGYHGAPGHAGAGPADPVLCCLRHKAPVRPSRRHRQPSRRPGVPGIHGGLPGPRENPWRRFTKPCWPGTSFGGVDLGKVFPRVRRAMPYTASATPPPRRTSTPCAPRCTIF